MWAHVVHARPGLYTHAHDCACVCRHAHAVTCNYNHLQLVAGVCTYVHIFGSTYTQLHVLTCSHKYLQLWARMHAHTRMCTLRDTKGARARGHLQLTAHVCALCARNLRRALFLDETRDSRCTSALRCAPGRTKPGDR